MHLKKIIITYRKVKNLIRSNLTRVSVRRQSKVKSDEAGSHTARNTGITISPCLYENSHPFNFELPVSWNLSFFLIAEALTLVYHRSVIKPDRGHLSTSNSDLFTFGWISSKRQYSLRLGERFLYLKRFHFFAIGGNNNFLVFFTGLMTVMSKRRHANFRGTGLSIAKNPRKPGLPYWDSRHFGIRFMHLPFSQEGTVTNPVIWLVLIPLKERI